MPGAMMIRAGELLMSTCKSSTTILEIESESKNDLEDSPRSRTKKAVTKSESILNLSTTKEMDESENFLNQSESVVAVKKTTRPRKTNKKAAPELSTDIITPIKAESDIAITTVNNAFDQQTLAAFNFTTQAQTLFLAIRDNRAVELIFVDSESNPPRTFEPRQLIFDTFAKDWYIYGWDRRYNTERHHLISLISKINVVKGIGRAAQGLYKSDTPANFIGGWLGGEVINIKLILLKQWIFAVRQAPLPFPDFKMEEIEEGRAQVTFTATDLRSVARWVMQFGDGVQIIEPQRLIDRIKQVGLAWSSRSTATTHTLKVVQTRQEQRPERKTDYRPDNKLETPIDHKSSNQPKYTKDNTEVAKISKVEIRTDRL